MIIVSQPITLAKVHALAQNRFGDMIKGVVDIDRHLLALDAELHADLEKLLLENGSKQTYLWGINIYPEIEDDDWLEFDSMINLRPNDNNVTRGVDDPKIQDRIRTIVNELIER